MDRPCDSRRNNSSCFQFTVADLSMAKNESQRKCRHQAKGLLVVHCSYVSFESNRLYKRQCITAAICKTADRSAIQNRSFSVCAGVSEEQIFNRTANTMGRKNCDAF